MAWLWRQLRIPVIFFFFFSFQRKVAYLDSFSKKSWMILAAVDLRMPYMFMYDLHRLQNILRFFSS